MDKPLLKSIINPSPAVPAPLKHASSESNSAIEKKGGWGRSLLFGALASIAFLWVALYNGYPTVFSDTGGYLWTGLFHIALAPFRAPGYSVFTHVTSLGKTAWLTVALQAVIVVYALRETCAYLIRGESKFVDRCFLAAVCVLATATSMSWLTSLVMPDVFAGVMFLSAFLLTSSGELRAVQRLSLAGILALSMGTHMSLFPIAALYAAAVVVFRYIEDRRFCRFPAPRPTLAWLLVPMIAAGFWTCAQNHRMGIGFRLSPSKNTFLLGRLFGDGLAPEFLRESCPTRLFISCNYLPNLPRTEEEFLFWHPLLQELKGHDDEIDAIVQGTLAAYPQRFLLSSFKQTWLQLAAFRTGDEIRTYGAEDWNNHALERVFPDDSEAFWNGKQFRGRLLPLVDAVAPFHSMVFWLSVFACLLFAWTGRFARMNTFFTSAIAFLIINAAVCGSFAGVFDRYQSRVAWIIPFCLTAYVSCFVKERAQMYAEADLTYRSARMETRLHHPNLVRIPTHPDSENSSAAG